MAETFVISRGAQDEAEVVYVEIRHDGVSGYGEAAPIERYDESAASALAFLQEAGELLGDDPFALEAIEARLRSGPASWRRRPGSTRRCTTSAASSSACRSGGCSGSSAPGRRPRSRSGSAIPTTWPGGPSASAAGSSG